MIVSELINIVKDLVDTVDVKDANEIMRGYKNSRNPLNNSIKSRAKDLVLQYPVLLSDTLSLDSALLVNRALQHEYINLVSILINNGNIADANGKKTIDAAEFLKRYHQNINRSYFESVSISDIEKCNKSLLENLDSKINGNILNEFTIPKYVLLEANKKGNRNNNRSDTNNSANSLQINNVSAKIEKYDMKKINELTPTMITTTITWKVGNETVSQNITFGIKTVSHLVSSNDIVYYLSDGVKDSNKLLQLIRWTTGEIKLVKDIILAADVNRKMAEKHNDGNDNYWWKKLSSLSQSARIRNLLKAGNFLGKDKNVPMPITTLCISKQDVDNIRNKHGVDLIENTRQVYKIMQKFFLLTFLIVDETTQTVYLYNEDTRDYSIYSFKSLINFSKEEHLFDNGNGNSLFNM